MNKSLCLLAMLPAFMFAPGVCSAQEGGNTAKAPRAAAVTLKLAPTDRVRKSLQLRLDALDGKEHTLNELLQLFAMLTTENFILDPSLPKSVGETKISVRVKKGGTVLDAFAVALALTGLRYGILDGAVFVSTEGKLSDRLLSGRAAGDSMGSSKARQPMSVGEAVVKSQPFDPYQDGFITSRDFIRHNPWRFWEPPRYNPKTGLTDYPGPPIWQEDPDIGHPRFRYTATPFFLKPEYLALEQEKREMREAQAERQRRQRGANAQALAEVLKMLKANPNLTAKQIMEKLSARAK